jgi:Family of unknown function (DUF5681)
VSALRKPSPNQYKPGQSGNPGGRPKLPEHLRLIKAFTAEEIQRIIAKHGRSTLDNILKIKDDPKAAVIDRIFARMFHDSFFSREGEALNAIKFILDRSIGKVPDVVLTEPEDDQEREGLRKLTLEELLHLVRRMIPNEPIPA